MTDGEGATARATGPSYAALMADPRLLVVLAVSVTGTMGLNVVSPALPSVSETLAVSDAQIGLVMTAYTLPAMVVTPVAGVLADMYGRRVVVLPALFVFAVAGTAIGFVDSFTSILALRAVQGAAVSGFMPLSVTLLGDIYSGSDGATAQGLRVGANGAWSVVVPLIAGVLAGVAWNVPFFMFGFAFVVCALAYRYVPETTGGVDTEVSMVATLRGYARSLKAELTDLELGVLISGGFARDFVRYAVSTFVPLFAVRAFGATFAEAGAILALKGVVSIFISPVSGSISSRLSHRWSLVLATVISGVGVASFTVVPSSLWLAAAVVLFSVGDGLFSPVIKDAVTSETTDEYRSGVVSGMQVLKYGAQTASPAFFGVVLAVAGFGTLFGVAATVSAVYALCVVAFVGNDVGNGN